MFFKHGYNGTGTYETWRGMKGRCLNKKRNDYKYYGGRGIKVCERWLEFKNFLDDMGERPEGKTLDRKDNDGNYEPSNCRWATKQEQQLNRNNYTGLSKEEYQRRYQINNREKVNEANRKSYNIHRKKINKKRRELYRFKKKSSHQNHAE